nr:hypothetical protein [Sphingomonas melonis]
MIAGAIIALALQAATPAAHVDRSAAKWGVEYAPNQCIINRASGMGRSLQFWRSTSIPNPIVATSSC